MKRPWMKFISGSIISLCMATLMFGVNAVIGALLWPYAINSWLVFLGKPASIVWWQGALIGFVPYVGPLSIPAAAITFILMLFLV